MNAFEALQEEVDRVPAESDIVFVSVSDAREILSTYQQFQRIAGAWQLVPAGEKRQALEEYDRLVPQRKRNS